MGYRFILQNAQSLALFTMIVFHPQLCISPMSYASFYAVTTSHCPYRSINLLKCHVPYFSRGNVRGSHI